MLRKNQATQSTYNCTREIFLILINSYPLKGFDEKMNMLDGRKRNVNHSSNYLQIGEPVHFSEVWINQISMFANLGFDKNNSK